jgi:pimeloyl-ACP methyl ester carboxylesterase
MTTLLTVLLVVFGAYAFMALFALATADAFIFRPRVSSYRDGGRIVRIPAADGTPLAALHLRASDPIATVLYLHGNAEDLGDILPHLEKMQRHGFDVLAFDYRGYGLTPGRPSEAALHADAWAVFRHLVDVIGVSESSVLLYGRSLGGGPATELATRAEVRGLVLDGAFMSAFRVVTRLPVLPGDRFRNLVRIRNVRCPVLVLHGTLDRVTSVDHGRALFAAAPEPKRHLWVEGAGHNDLVDRAGEAYWETLTAFARDPSAKARG